MELAEVDSATLFGLIIMMTQEIWIVVDNAAFESMDPRTAVAISYLAAALLAFDFIVVSDASLVVTARGELLAGVAGPCTGVGLISTYTGFTRDSTTVVSTLGAMYFVVVAAISVIVLGENLTIMKLAGITFTVPGIVLATCRVVPRPMALRPHVYSS